MKKESFIYSTLTIGGSKEQVNEVMKYICDDIYDIGSIDSVSYTHLTLPTTSRV